MEKKRKVPPRAAAREHVTKKRNATPTERSVTPQVAEPPPPAPPPEEPQLPKSIQAGNPLPTVENAQPDDLSIKEYQSVQESGVLAESLVRSRQKWVNEALFEKYWTKPTKRKGVVKEEPNNPPKDSMTKIGQVSITIEPHVLEATMFAVKDPKPPAPTTNSTFRPIMQYGPPNGAMPPPPTPKPATPTATPAAVASPAQTPAPASGPVAPPTQQAPKSDGAQPQPSPARAPQSAPLTSPLAPPAGLQPPQTVHTAPAPPATTANPPSLSQPSPAGPATGGSNQPPSTPTTSGPTPPPSFTAPPPAPKPEASTPSGADPIIVTLAERASNDAYLREVMKRVAVNDAKPDELRYFQKVIDQITVEYRNKGGQQGPSADRLIVDGRTVKYFADEVRTILDIVLASNPQQRGVDLRPPPGCDPLVILLVRQALDSAPTRDLVRRVADNKTRFNDATDLKATLDQLKHKVKEAPKPQPTAAPPQQNGPPQNQAHTPGAQNAQPTGPQALRSKGPPPLIKHDISAVVLEFQGGTGDRYLFPKFSILEYASPQQLVASFLIVRKGSKSEYGGDPSLDYYQPVTVRMYSHSPKVLENLAKVVAPQDEVRRYMDDVMDNMTRAEYVLLAMRLPRHDKDEAVDDRSSTPKVEPSHQPAPQQPGVLWTSKANSTAMPPQKMTGKALNEEEQYQNFISTVS